MSESLASQSPMRAVLLDCLGAGIAAAAPGPAISDALQGLQLPQRAWILAAGKAALGMAEACRRAIGASRCGGTLVVTSGPMPAPGQSRLEIMTGDHPLPGAGSFAAAHRVEVFARDVPRDAELWVLLSGGATSLLAAPTPGLCEDDLIALFRSLHASGLPIQAMNRIRKRLTRWGAGRLAADVTVARIRQFILSDVIGNDLAAIGSGPCMPVEGSAEDAIDLLHLPTVRAHITPDLLDRAAKVLRQSGGIPHPADQAFDLVTTVVVGDNHTALAAAAERARALGFVPLLRPEPIIGEASTAGGAFAAELTRLLRGDQGPLIVIQGGETTVSLGAGGGVGGRCQEFALAAAGELTAQRADSVLLLAAGTDGRDGPTTAAGAIVSAGLWESVHRVGMDPQALLASHRSYEALAAAGAVIRIGHTGTNVMDLAIGFVPPPRR